MMERTWYLGPLGKLRPLDCPETDVTMNNIRYGGVHQGLSGARTMDVTGHRHEYEFEFKWLEKEDWTWLEVLNSRMVPGPFYLLNPLTPNRLSLQSSRLLPDAYGSVGNNYKGGVWSFNPTFPAEIPFGVRSLKTFNWVSGFEVQFDPNRPTPVLLGETITSSVYLKSDEAQTVKMVQRHYVDGTVVVSPEKSISVTTEWQRFTHTYTPSSSQYLDFVLIPSAYSLYVAAPQVEASATASDWSLGGGAVQVVLDQLETSSPRFPLRDCSMTLLET